MLSIFSKNVPFAAAVRSMAITALVVLAGCAANVAHLQGLSAFRHGDYAKAVAGLEQAAKLEPQDVIFRKDWLRNRELATHHLLNQADNAQLAGNLALAEQHYRTILKFEKGNARAISGLEKLARIKLAADEAARARAAIVRGDQRSAAELSTRALKNDPNQAEARTVRAQLDAIEAQQMISTPSLDAMYKKPINLEFRDASVRVVLDALSRTTGINFIFDRDVRLDQRASVFLRQTTLEDAIDVFLTTNQLEKKILNSTSILIYPAGVRAKEYQDLVVRAFYLSSAEAKNTATLLKTMLKIKDVFVDEKMNMLVLREPPDTIALAEKLINLHDLDQPEVMLDVEVLEVNRSRLLDLGIKITDKITVSPLAGGTMLLSDVSDLNKSKLGVTIPSATISANADNRNTNLLANPRIRVRDREKAQFMIGDKVPIITTTNTPNGFSSENITYQDVGLKLEVEPEVRSGDEIGLRMTMEVSSLVSSIKTNNGSIAYQIGARSVSSVLRLKDGETQVLAGLISDEDRSTANGLPFLNELPVLGRLFAAKQDARTKTEIVLSITPRLIRNMQRKAPAAEAFWSGTEANLRLKPMQLRAAQDGPAGLGSIPMMQGAPAVMPDPATIMPPPVRTAPGTSVLPVGAPLTGAQAADRGTAQLRWIGPALGKVGANVVLELNVSTPDALRAASLQVSYDPALFKVVSVSEGDFFRKKGASNFSHNVDAATGRITVGSASAAAGEATGGWEGGVLKIELQPLAPSPVAQVVLMGFTPIGSVKSAPRPSLPVVHQLMIGK